MRVKFAGLVIAASLIGVAPSHATIVPVTYTGTVSSVVDGADIFGSPADGQSFTLKFTFNTDLGPISKTSARSLTTSRAAATRAM